MLSVRQQRQSPGDSALARQRESAFALHDLACVPCRRSEYARAKGLFQQALHLSWEQHLYRSVCGCLEGLAWVISLQGENQVAARILGASEALRRTINLTRLPADQVWQETLLEQIKTQLGEPEFEASWAHGNKLELEKIINLPLSLP